MSSSIIKVCDLVNTCVILSQRAGLHISRVQASGDLHTRQKGFSTSDVVTEADLVIQKTIHSNLKALYPKARIVCEEDEKDVSR